MFFQKKKKNSRQTYALHLMNSLLNIFCYIISNVSIRINLHRVWLMTESYPVKQNYSKKPYKGHDTFFPINLGQSSQDSKNLSKAKQSKAYTSSGFQAMFLIKLRQPSQDLENLSGCQNNQGHHPESTITRGISPIVYISQSPREANLS